MILALLIINDEETLKSGMLLNPTHITMLTIESNIEVDYYLKFCGTLLSVAPSRITSRSCAHLEECLQGASYRILEES